MAFDPLNPDDFPPPPNIPGPVGGGGQPAPAPSPVDIPSSIPAGGGGNHGHGGGGGTGLPGYPQFNIPGAPAFNFHAPTAADAQNEPGYQFRLAAGQQGLEHSQAAQGMVRSGGSLSDLLEYNQNFGSNEYQRVYDRMYQNAHDAYAPLLAQWNLRAGGEQQAQLANYNAQLQQHLNPHNNGGGTDWSSYIDSNPWDPPKDPFE